MIHFTAREKRMCLIAAAFPSSSIKYSSGRLTLDVAGHGIRRLTFFCDKKYLNKQWGGGKGCVLSSRVISEALFMLLPS
jgi:hypothetical protein